MTARTGIPYEPLFSHKAVQLPRDRYYNPPQPLVEARHRMYDATIHCLGTVADTLRVPSAHCG